MWVYWLPVSMKKWGVEKLYNKPNWQISLLDDQDRHHSWQAPLTYPWCSKSESTSVMFLKASHSISIMTKRIRKILNPNCEIFYQIAYWYCQNWGSPDARKIWEMPQARMPKITWWFNIKWYPALDLRIEKEH